MRIAAVRRFNRIYLLFKDFIGLLHVVKYSLVDLSKNDATCYFLLTKWTFNNVPIKLSRRAVVC